MSGSVLDVWIDDIHYDAAADAVFNTGLDIEKEGVRHSGGSSFKVTLKTQEIEGVDLITDATAADTLRDVNKKKENVSFGWEEEDGAIYNGEGAINLTGKTSDDFKTSMTFLLDGKLEVTLP
ncbi:MAG: hypothetical protein GWP06_00315 [Actinobacteria bacterium]|nr:hypothetical protein [Actinomycetota bacterium]